MSHMRHLDVKSVEAEISEMLGDCIASALEHRNNFLRHRRDVAV
jgi:hypothetical protein